jgi:hypothetical protein
MSFLGERRPEGGRIAPPRPSGNDGGGTARGYASRHLYVIDFRGSFSRLPRSLADE